ncbi:MAG TPA: MiaB/RimO family radical SAM methylthiotransferase [Terracidiphilus sp.]|nr:MiaB/RimO family radical SAM methylthiotransferase [Terracidiphilus sp.]
MPGFHVENFGCRAARADGEALSGRLRAAGHADSAQAEAELIVVNTCSVTAEADRAARAYIRRAHRLNPEARIIVAGCYAQRAPDELAAIAGVSAVIGNSHTALAPEIALKFVGGTETTDKMPVAGFVPTHSLLSGAVPIWADDRFAHSFIEEAPLAGEHQTRPNLKIQEGCANRCTFCVIPQTRGPSRSLGREEILRQIDAFVASGGKELVLSGINLGRWGRDLAAGPSQPRPTLAALVREILQRTSLPRLRLSSIEPMDWDQELVALMHEYGGSRLARHAHLPLQSGSDAVLRRMHRRYRPWHYAEKVAALIAAAGPDLTLGADVIIGFPGETDAEFEETLAFIRELPFGYLHLFPFSPRPGTPGWQLYASSPVPARVIQDRISALRALAAEKMRAHRERFVGRKISAITLHTPEALVAKKHTAALTENFLPVELEGCLAANRLVQVQPMSLKDDGTLFCAAQNAA